MTKLAGHNALADAHAEAVARFAAENPRSRERHDAACAVMPGGNTRTVLYYDPFPLMMVSGEGCRLTDADGHTYIDFLGEFTAGLYGHSDPVIAAAIREALENGLNLGGHGPLEAEFAALVKSRFPSMELLRFTNSGTEANVLALALAKHATGRPEVMVFGSAYHGATLTFQPGGSPVNIPHDYVVARYNEVEETRALIRAHAGTLAAVIVEPMLGGGGCLPGDPEFLKMLREETGKAGAILVFDEVMTSRLGPGGRQGELGIRPDLTTLGKYIGGGMSFGAFGGRADLMAHFDPSSTNALPHAGTFNNNVLTMAAGLVGLSRRYTPEAAQALNARGDALRERLNAIFLDRELAMCVTGIGSLMNIHPVAATPRAPSDLVAVDRQMRDLVFFDLLADGIYTARRGLMALSLPITDEEIEILVSSVWRRVPRWQTLMGGIE